MHSNVNQLTNINRSKFIQIVWKQKSFNLSHEKNGYGIVVEAEIKI